MLRRIAHDNAKLAADYPFKGLDRPSLSIGYYTKGDVQPVVYVGKLCTALGLVGPPNPEDFERVLSNRHPQTGEKLTPRDIKGRVVCQEIHISDHKSQTIMALFDPRIRQARRKAVLKLADLIESDMMTRVRKGGKDENRRTGRIAGILASHGEARPVDGIEDPDDHDHLLIAAITHDPIEKRLKAAQFGRIGRRMDVYQAFYHNEVAHQLHAIGYVTEPGKRGGIAIKGVSEQQCTEFSRRTGLIERTASERGITDPKQLDELGARTREPKIKGRTQEQREADWLSRISPENKSSLRALAAEAIRRCESTPDPEPALESTNAPTRRRTSNDPEAFFREALERHKARTLDGSIVPASSDTNPPIPNDTRREPPGLGLVPVQPRTKDASQIPPRPKTLTKAFTTWTSQSIVDHAIEEVFSTRSDITHDGLLRRALKIAPGHATFTEIKSAINDHPGLIFREVLDTTYVTTQEAARDEQDLIRLAKAGRNTQRQLASTPISTHLMGLDDRARDTVSKSILSRNDVLLLKATGNDQALPICKAIRTAIWQSGRTLVTVGTNTHTARRAERAYGLSNVMPLEQLLSSSSDQAKLESLLFRTVIWVEDAGRLGVRSAVKLLRLAKKYKCRVVLAGDEKGLAPSQRGDAFRLLRWEAGLTTAEYQATQASLRPVQKMRHALVEHDVDGFLKHADIGNCVHNTSREQDLIALAVDRFREMDSPRRPALALAPSRRTAEEITEALRADLRSRKKLKGPDRSALQLIPVPLSAKQKKSAASYKRGQVLQFHRRVIGFNSGERAKVIAVDPFGHVWIRSRFGAPKLLPLETPDRFSVFVPKRIRVAIGDRIRITRSARPVAGKRLRAGSVHRVIGLVPLSGDLILNSGRILSRRKAGHFDLDYASSVHGSSGRRSSKVIFAIHSRDEPLVHQEHLIAATDIAAERLEIVQSRDNLRKIAGRMDMPRSAEELAHSTDGRVLRELAYRVNRSNELDHTARGFHHDR